MRFRKNVMLKNSVHFWKISKIWKRNISFKYEVLELNLV